MSVMRKAVLQLNVSYEAIRIVTARRALTLVTKGKAVVEVATDRMIYPGVYLPSVIRLRTYKHIPIRMQLVTRKNIYVRDGYRCNYCGHKFRGDQLTLDHITPKAQGGRSTWDNLTAACAPCNRSKDDRTPEEAGMLILKRPLPVSVHSSRFMLRSMGLETEKEWGRYLYSDSGGDKQFMRVGV